MADTEPKIIHKALSYEVTGLLFKVHNAIGRFGRERQYADALQTLFEQENIEYAREKSLPIPFVGNPSTNKADFVVGEKIVVELKAKPLITKEDYAQIHRYLQAGNYKLGLVVNFRNKYLRPIRV